MQRLLAILVVTTACHPGGALLEGLARTPADDHGPAIVWDLEATPLPELPLPNDIATRPDSSAATGRRLNLPRQAPTNHEARLRDILDTLDGFSTYGPIWLSFEGRIDVAALSAAHADLDAANDMIYLVDVTAGSPTYGRATPLDVGNGRFPLGLERTDQFFGNDPRAGASNLLFETVNEDTDGDGLLSPEEDTDDDGVLDVANVWSTLGFEGRDDPYADLVTAYDIGSNTLQVRPILPLEQLTTYAVVITRRLSGVDTGSPVRSPFPFVHHLQQTKALRPLVDDGLLAGLGLSLEDVAFAWSFTTQSVTKDLETIRSGLWGIGPMARLAGEYPARLTKVSQARDDGGNLYILDVERIVQAFENSALLDVVGQSEESKAPLAQAYRDNVDYLVFAELESPYFIDNEDGAFRMDWRTGSADYQPGPLYLFCVVPKAGVAGAPPFPVILYAHGTGSSRLELLGFAGFYAGMGFATCGIDMVSHGLADGPLIRGIATGAMAPFGLNRAIELVFTGRAKDFNADGTTDPAGDFWTANLFHTRDVVRQSVVDHFQLLRVLRAFGGTTMPVDVDGDGDRELAGDFNGDGVVDFGGERPYFMTGGSLGGIMTAVVGPLEPAIVAMAPVSAGAGLSDIAVRSVQRYALEAIWMPILGPFVIGRSAVNGTAIDFTFDLLDVATEVEETFARAPDAEHPEAVAVGDRIRLENLDKGTSDEVLVRTPSSGAPGQVRLQLGADRGDRVRLSLFRAGEGAPYRVIDTFERDVKFQGEDYAKGSPLVFLQEGHGFRRGSRELRRLTSVAQIAVDPGDPVNYARYIHDPLDLPPDGKVHKNMLLILTPGDMNVPINTGLALARTSGLWDPMAIDPRYGMSIDELLRTTHAPVGLDTIAAFGADACRYHPGNVVFDLDELSQGLDAEQGPHLSSVVRPPICQSEPESALCQTSCEPLPPLRQTVEKPWGTSGLRMPYIEPTGIHGIDLPNPSLDFDYSRFEIRQIGWYFTTLGHDLADDTCLASPTAPCAFLPDVPDTITENE